MNDTPIDLNTVHTLAEVTAAQLSGVAALRWLIPLLTIAGPAALLYYGLQGVLNKKTIVGYRFDQRIVTHEVTGGAAVVVGVAQVATAALLLALLAPLSASLLGLW